MIDSESGGLLEWGCRQIVPPTRVSEREPIISHECQVRDDKGTRGDSAGISEFLDALRHALADYFERLSWTTSS